MKNSNRPVRIALADLQSSLPSKLFVHLAGPQLTMPSDTDRIDLDEGGTLSRIMSSRQYHLLAPGEKKRATGWYESLDLHAARSIQSELAPDEDRFTLAGEVNFEPVDPESKRKIEPIPLAMLIGEKDEKYLRVNQVRVGRETIPASPARVHAAVEVLRVCQAFILASRKLKTLPADYMPLCMTALRQDFPGTAQRELRIIETTRIELAGDKAGPK